MKQYVAPFAVGAALATVIAVIIWPRGSDDGDGQGPANVSGSAGEQVEMTMHVMSQCPHGVKVVDSMIPVARELGDRFKLNLEYIGRIQGNKLSSMHGEDEVNGNKLQLCAHRHASYEQWLNFLECQNKNWRGIPEGWERCARRADVDVDTLRTCYEGDEGTGLLRASFEASQEAKATGSPTMFLNGKRYEGGRSEQAFARAVCAEYEGAERPNYCGELPPPPEVPITVLVDRRCTRPECDVDREVAQLEGRILGAKIDRIDYTTARGRELFEESGLKMLPAILIGHEIQRDRDAFMFIRRLQQRGQVQRSGDMYVNLVGRFDPVEGEWVPRPEVPVRILSDSRCDERRCKSVGQFARFVKRLAPNSRITELEYTEEDGRALWKQVSASVDDSGLKLRRGLALPLVLFGQEIEQEPALHSRLQRQLQKLDDQFLFVLGSWDPTVEICDNDVDDDGDGRIDCRDDQCSEQMACRQEMPRKLQAFVMSQCPYGVKVVDAMEEVLKNFGRDRTKIDFQIEFIGSVGDEGELDSMHGEDEVNEDLRQICAQHHYGDNYAFMDYVLCRNKNYRSNDWESCATGPIKADVIRECAEGDEGQRLLRESFELAKSLGITGSPSWLLNNKLEMRGRSPEDIKNAFCERNELPECENTLSKSGGSARGGC